MSGEDGDRWAATGTADGPPSPRPAEGRAQTLCDPDPEAAADLVAAGLEAGTMVTVAGRCRVSYEGRAASEAGPGRRQLLGKPDGTLLVHDAEGHRPVNWLGPGSDRSCWTEAGGDGGRGAPTELVVAGSRTAPEERLVVRFEAVDLAAAVPVASAPTPAVVGTEADLAARVLDRPALVEEGFTPLATERQTPAGPVDVYGRDAEGRTVVLELKRRRAGTDAVGQLDRYVGALQRSLHADAAVRGVLVAPSVTERAAALLEERGLEFVPLRPDRAVDDG